ncbi:hypothetical protein QR680_004343 [Steinernema hermaphroditum]|uniref:DNA2/NAM7 helicase-like C-terminal domain-containing protein n=1 Tax=Steinernema hermaphroditum TaxID=289476 RepID=A0AA39HPH8_9BILA|nr:hypothetical protein QR680_004343 [Steinernema hermaphroditum]
MCVENAYKHCIFDPDRCVDINGMKCCASNRADVNMIPLVHRQYPQRLDLEFDDSMADGYDLSSDDAKNAVFWFMTVDMAILHSREMRFESLLVDECSAVTIPQLYGLFVAAQWPDFLCAVGDPKQLGPHPGTHMIDLDTTKQYTERKRRNLKTDKDLEKLSTFHTMDGHALAFHVIRSNPKRVGSSYQNKAHVAVIQRVLELLDEQEQSKTVVLTPYTAQKALESILVVPVFTVDAYIGCEQENVILSLPSPDLGFLADEQDKVTNEKSSKRAFVMLTRAQKKLFVIGSFNEAEGNLIYDALYKNEAVKLCL